MKKKKVEAPKYEELADTAFISGLREDLPTYRDRYNYMLGQLDVTSPEVQQAYRDLANQYTQAQWSDYNRNALQGMKALNASNYNRFGSLGSSGAMYNTDTYNRNLNNLAANIAGNTAAKYEDLINNYYNQKATTANAYNSAYSTAGNTLQNNDIANWNIRNNNKYAQYVADVQNAQNNTGILGGIKNIIGGGLQGAGNGFSVAGPWGALAGGIAGSVGGTLDTMSGNSYNSQGSWTSVLAPNIGGGLTNMFGSNGGLNLNTKSNTVSSPTNYRTYMGGNY